MPADDVARIGQQVEVEMVIGLWQEERRDAEEMAGAVQIGLLIKIGAIALLLPPAALQKHGMMGAVGEEETRVEVFVRTEADETRIALHHPMIPSVAHADQFPPPGKSPRVPFLAEDHVRIKIQDVLRLRELLEKPRLEIDGSLRLILTHRLLPENPRLQPRPPPHTLRRQLRHPVPDRADADGHC